MAEIPNLAGVATQNLVETIKTGSFSAAYINWARTVNLLREHAPGWMADIVRTEQGEALHPSPVGAFMLIRFRHLDGTETTPVPQAVMDSYNKAVARDKITARDITDTHRRGVCMAAAFTFGLAYELWAKMPLESGYAEAESAPEPTRIHPAAGVMESMSAEKRTELEHDAVIIGEYMDAGDVQGAFEYIASKGHDNDTKTALWTLLPSKTRTALKKANNERAAA